MKRKLLCFLILLQVFVEYANAGDSKAAQKLLTGRMFDGKFVVATFLPTECLQEGISVSNFALISNLRTVFCFSSSISWVILHLNAGVPPSPLTILREYFVYLFSPANVQPLLKQ